MRLYLVRHAHAGNRSAWQDADARRPLSRKGWKQAAALADRLAGAGIGRLVSSPSLRCMQTLEPLAERLSLPVEADARLLEGARGTDALALACELRDGHGSGGPEAVALCSHGDVIPEVLRALLTAGTRIADPLVWPKGSVWLVRGEGDRWTAASYLAPP